VRTLGLESQMPEQPHGGGNLLRGAVERGAHVVPERRRVAAQVDREGRQVGFAYGFGSGTAAHDLSPPNTKSQLPNPDRSQIAGFLLGFGIWDLGFPPVISA